MFDKLGKRVLLRFVDGVFATPTETVLERRTDHQLPILPWAIPFNNRTPPVDKQFGKSTPLDIIWQAAPPEQLITCDLAPPCHN